MLVTHHQPSQTDQCFYENVDKRLDMYWNVLTINWRFYAETSATNIPSPLHIVYSFITLSYHGDYLTTTNFSYIFFQILLTLIFFQEYSKSLVDTRFLKPDWFLAHKQIDRLIHMGGLFHEKNYQNTLGRARASWNSKFILS